LKHKSLAGMLYRAWEPCYLSRKENAPTTSMADPVSGV